MGGLEGLSDDIYLTGVAATGIDRAPSHSYPESGRTIGAVHRESWAWAGRRATPYQVWKALVSLQKRHEAIVRKDPKGNKAKTARSAAIAAAVWEWRLRNGTKIPVE